MAPQILIFDSLTSTQDRAFALAAEGAPEWTTVIAEVQTQGRGQFQREWFSKKGGLWMSVVVPARGQVTDLPLRMADAVVDVLNGLAPPGGWPSISVKYPNDVLLGGKKVCGILCEMRSSLPNYAVVGIGLNVVFLPEDFPSELRNIATSLRIAFAERWFEYEHRISPKLLGEQLLVAMQKAT